MFRTVPGYEGCRIHAGEQPVAFVSFVDRQAALDAKAAYHGLRFDPFVPTVMKITFAKANSKNKALPQEFFIRPERSTSMSSRSSSRSESFSSSRSHSESGPDQGAARHAVLLDPVALEKVKAVRAQFNLCIGRSLAFVAFNLLLYGYLFPHHSLFPCLLPLPLSSPLFLLLQDSF